MESRPTLEELEQRLRDVSLEMDAEAMRRAGYRIVDWLIDRQAGMRSSPLGRELKREETERLLREPMPEEASSFDRVFEEYAAKVAPNAVPLDHPRFFAFIPSAPNFVAVLAEALVAGTNVFAGTWLESSGPSQVEVVVLDWFKQMLGLPGTAGGVLVSGGSVANLTGLAAARQAILNDDPARAVIYFSNQTHASVDRALRVLGFHDSQIRRLGTGPDLRLDIAALREAIARDRANGLRPFAVVGNAGTTNTGAVDQLGEIAGVAHQEGLWFHVDAAYGGFAALTERGRRQLAGIEQADSVVLDPHKWFYCPFEVGCVLVREARRLRETFRILPDYMRDVVREEREINFCDYGVQLTRSFRALKVWMTVKTFGARRLREVLDQCLDLAEYGAQLFARSPRIEILAAPQLAIFAFRYLPERIPGSDRETFLNRLNERLQDRIIAGRELMISSTRLGERFVLRFCVLNDRTRREDVRAALDLILNYGREVEGDAPTA